MGLFNQIILRFRVVDYIFFTFCLFGIGYASLYYNSFATGKVLEPSRFVVTKYHQSKGADTYDKMVALGEKEGFYEPGQAPEQRRLTHWEVVRFFLIMMSVSLFMRLALSPNNAGRFQRLIGREGWWVDRFIPGFFRFWHAWYPYFTVPICLYSVGWLNQVHFDALPYDTALVRIDYDLFLSQPALDFYPKVQSWLLDEFMSLAYFNFYYLGLAIGLPIYIKCTDAEFEFFMTILIIGFLSNFVLSILLPAAGPIFQFTEGIRFPYFPNGSITEEGLGPFTYLMRHLIYTGEIPAGAMPSSHCSIAFISVIFGFKHFGKWGYLYLFWASSLWVSTVYLQQHYLIDVFAGLFMAYPVYYFFGHYLTRRIDVVLHGWQAEIIQKRAAAKQLASERES